MIRHNRAARGSAAATLQERSPLAETDEARGLFAAQRAILGGAAGRIAVLSTVSAKDSKAGDLYRKPSFPLHVMVW